MANKGVDGEPLPIVYKRHSKLCNDALSRPEEHIHNILTLVISPVMSSTLKPLRSIKDIYSHTGRRVLCSDGMK
jgi:hypothetical protein